MLTGLLNTSIPQRRRWFLVAGAAAACIACVCAPLGCAARRTLGGFPDQSLRDYSCCAHCEALGTINEDIKTIDQEIAKKPNDQAASYRQLLGALLVLSNDQPDHLWLPPDYEYHVFKQVLPPSPTPPLQLYPRLTHPHVAEPEAHGDGQTWRIPVVLSRRALAGEVPTRASALLQRIRLLPSKNPTDPDAVGEALSFWLAPRSSCPSQQRWIRLAQVHLGQLRLPERMGEFDLRCPDYSTLGLVLSVNSEALETEPVTCPPDVFGDLRILPRLNVPDCGQTPTGFASYLAEGDWLTAKKELARIIGSGSLVQIPDLHAIECGVNRSLQGRNGTLRVGRFRHGLRHVRRACKALRKAEERAGGCVTYSVAAKARELDEAFDDLLSQESPAPVLLDRGSPDEGFSFIVAGDLQFHEPNPEIERFFAYLNGDPNHITGLGSLRADTQEHIRDAKFVLLDGDLCDGAANSVRRIFGRGVPGQIFFNGLGFFPPSSPYSAGGEMGEPGTGRHRRDHDARTLQDFLRASSKPIFAVPGNHDGFVGYGGVLSVFLDSLAEFLNEFTLFRNTLARWVFRVNEYVPHGVKFYAATTFPPATAGMVPRQSRPGRRLTPRQGDGLCSWFWAPRYDGLVEWRWYLGPLNVAFSYRNCAFLGLNSYDLSQPDRAGVGALVSNWGGGIKERDALWLDMMLARQGSDEDGEYPRRFLFMHHDPRGFTPVVTASRQIVEPRTPAFDSADSWGNYLTFGYLGLQYSPAWGLFIPVITPAVEYGSDYLRYPDRFNQEWTLGYGEDKVTRAVDSLDGRSESVNVFFAHNDLPINDSPWRDQCGALFPEQNPPSLLSGIIMVLFKGRDEDRPNWADAIKPVTRCDNKISVTRLDDVGDFGGNPIDDKPGSRAREGDAGHGFHVVTVKPGKALQIQHVLIVGR